MRASPRVRYRPDKSLETPRRELHQEDRPLVSADRSRLRLDPADLIHHARTVEHVEFRESGADLVPVEGRETVSLKPYSCLR